MTAIYQLATNKYGSHIVDKCWSLVDLKIKEMIADELLKREDELKTNHYGRFVIRNCNLDYYKRKKPDWIDQERAFEKKKKMFEDVIQEDDDEKRPVSSIPTEANRIETILRERDLNAMDPIMLSLGYTKENVLSATHWQNAKHSGGKKPSQSDERFIVQDHDDPIPSDTSVRNFRMVYDCFC